MEGKRKPHLHEGSADEISIMSLVLSLCLMKVIVIGIGRGNEDSISLMSSSVNK